MVTVITTDPGRPGCSGAPVIERIPGDLLRVTCPHCPLDYTTTDTTKATR